jgi:hypothetical protein
VRFSFSPSSQNDGILYERMKRNKLIYTHKVWQNLFQRKGLHILLLGLLFSLLWSSFVPAQNGRAQSPFQVALVIQYPERLEKYCLVLNKTNPTGLDVLLEAGIPIIADPSGMGSAICSINGVGCPAEDCFCQSYSPPYYYWSYWHLQNGRWTYSSLGATAYTVKSGDVEGWLWGDARTPPQVVTFQEVCGVQATPTMTASVTPTPSVTATQTPSATPKTPTQGSAATITATRKPANSRTPTPTSGRVNPATATNTPYSATSTAFPTQRPAPGTAAIASPSPTITLAYAFLGSSPTQPFSPAPAALIATPTAAFDLQTFSLTATAVELERHQPTLVVAPPLPNQNSLTNMLKSGLAAFAMMVGGLAVLFIVVSRRGR